MADSSTAAETYALHELVKTVIEVHGKLVEMGETVETPVMLKQDNQAVIKMSEMITAHAGAKHLRIAQAFIHDEVREGLVKCEQASSNDNGADSSTKSPARQKFKKDMRERMGPQPGLE